MKKSAAIYEYFVKMRILFINKLYIVSWKSTLLLLHLFFVEHKSHPPNIMVAHDTTATKMHIARK